MGLLDTILKTGQGLVRQVPIAGPLAAGAIGTVGATLGIAAGGPSDQGLLEGANPIGNILDLALSPLDILNPLLGGGGGAVDMTGFSGGNGSRSTRTIVETMDLASGQIISRRILPGSPHMMNSDIKAAKKVFRQSAALQKRMPRKTVRESDATKLKNALVSKAMNSATGGECCPPKC